MIVGKLYTVARASQLELLQVLEFRDFVILGVNLAWKICRYLPNARSPCIS